MWYCMFRSVLHISVQVDRASLFFLSHVSVPAGYCILLSFLIARLLPNRTPFQYHCITVLLLRCACAARLPSDVTKYKYVYSIGHCLSPLFTL